MRKQSGALILLLVLAIGFLVAAYNLLIRRSEVGDIYPAYSSYRSDPLGSGAFYDSLKQLGINMSRSTDSSARLTGKQTTLFVCGLPSQFLLSRSRVPEQYLDFVSDGGRLVVALYPDLEKSREVEFACSGGT